ncbi:hypothetical protein BZA05DRAFT_139866 [Tricharina praecox]|uniref:uncharacterized protein n=1 Tax=Tricharina praecox TaxID=43433 RepID=UPI00221FFCC1|nr:uncharacterized protein BZA05DRAFT_139866 [Tricharina praecox]KAI5846144.1 hypothetical protein BZA05DRAFT_139866 [Tricharina praecox]
MPPLHLGAVRQYSHQAMKTSRTPQAIAIYSYLIVGFTLPWAGPMAVSIRGDEKGRDGPPLSLHHCCR